MKDRTPTRPIRPSISRPLRRSVCLCAALAVGCDRALCCEIENLAAVVYGTVSTAAGAPAVGARVFALARYPNCASDPVGGSDVVSTDPAGHYRAEIRQISRRAPMCTEGVVLPGAAGVADTVRAPGPVLDFRIPRRAASLDSGRVDVRLP